MTYDYDTSDPTFLADLRNSRGAVMVAAEWLSAKGYPVVVRPTFERPDASQMAAYADDGDLEIIQRVEVKRRVSMTFTSKADFTYPTLIVDACPCYDNARPKPYAYIILNRDCTAAFIVNVRETFSKWVRTEKTDRFKNRVRAFYECPMSLVTFEAMG